MTPIFVDTSALFAVLDADDAQHPRAKLSWERLLAEDRTLVSTNYVLVETFALVQHRLGMPALRTLQEDVIPVLTVEWIGEGLHDKSVAAVLTSGRRALSLVDCSSFEIMRELGIGAAFAFDAHFSEQGFERIPPASSDDPD